MHYIYICSIWYGQNAKDTLPSWDHTAHLALTGTNSYNFSQSTGSMLGYLFRGDHSSGEAAH